MYFKNIYNLKYDFFFISRNLKCDLYVGTTFIHMGHIFRDRGSILHNSSFLRLGL